MIEKECPKRNIGLLKQRADGDRGAPCSSSNCYPCQQLVFFEKNNRRRCQKPAWGGSGNLTAFLGAVTRLWGVLVPSERGGML